MNANLDEVLKLLAQGGGGEGATPFTFPAGLLGGGFNQPLSSGSQLDLALALQNGYSLPLLLSNAGLQGQGQDLQGALPFQAALGLPSLELPKLISLDVGADGTGGGQRAGADDNGYGSDPMGPAGASLPRRSGSGSGGQSARQLEVAPLSRQQQGAAKRERDIDYAALVNGMGKRSPAEARNGQAESRNARAGRADASGREAAERAHIRQIERQHEELAAKMLLLQRAAAVEEDNRRRMQREQQEQQEQEERDAQQQQQHDPSNTDTDTSEGAKAPRGGRGGGKKRGPAVKDPVARAQMRQLKKRDLNREAQRRFRDRQKAALALLESTTQSQQREIEALRLTNKLLEEQYKALTEQHKSLQLRYVTLQMKAQAS